MPRLPASPVVRQRGMTLIEILVVMVIIALMAAIMTVAVTALGRDTEVQDEAERLTNVLSVSLEQAELEGRDYGLRLEPGSYEVMVFDGRRGWVPVAGDRWLESHSLPPGLLIELEIEGRRVLLKKPESPEARLPQVLTFASGDVTPYRVTLSRSATDVSTTLVGAADGSIELAQSDAGA